MIKFGIPLFSIGSIEVVTSRKQAKKRLKELGIDYDLSDVAGCLFHECYQEHGVFILCVFDGKVSTLAHEAFHASIRILHHAGVHLAPNEPNEPHAYLLEHIVEKGEAIL